MPAFTDPNSPHDISELLMSPGFAHITITEERRNLAYECILLSEVVTKRITALDDLRRGLGEVKVSGVSLLSLLERYPELQQRVFPKDLEITDEREMASHIQYDESSNPLCNVLETSLNSTLRSFSQVIIAQCLKFYFHSWRLANANYSKILFQLTLLSFPHPPNANVHFS